MAPQPKKKVAHDSDEESGDFWANSQSVEKTLEDTSNRKENDATCCLCRLGKTCICLGLFALLIGGAVAGLSVAFTGDPNPANYFIPVDPPGKDEAVRWNADAGLYLTVENACDDSWTPYFDESLLEWNKTEALILRSQRVPYDEKCNPSRGRLKVCNGNYGNTDWKGLNTNVISAANGFVVYSTSKLNDFHLSSEADKAYTMCHENGHGFGLPHTDEDHFNRDRGDCMDYTTRTWNNLQPGDYNLNLLETLYGTPANPLTEDPFADGSTAAPTITPRRPPPPPPRPWNNNKDKEKEKEEEKEKEKEEEDDRRRLEHVPDFDTEIAAVLESCATPQCVHKLDDNFVVVINKLMV